MVGFIYILSNPRMPDLVKVGITEKHPALRAAELSDHTGVPEPFRLEYWVEVIDMEVAEREFAACNNWMRVNDSREFYRMAPALAMERLFYSVKDYIPERYHREEPRKRRDDEVEKPE